MTVRRIRPDTGAVSASRGRDARVPPGDQALPGPVRAGRRRARARGARGRDLRAGRPVGLRQDHRHADGQPHDRHQRGRHPARRRAASSERKPAELRREIGYAIQQIGLFPHLSVADNIATVPKPARLEPKDRIRARVDELLELVSLDPHETRDRYPAQLSGGQRQRVGVARALAVDPPLMLMDEPFGAIDPINRERLQNEFLRLQREIRKTIVFVTHDIDEAIKMGDRIAVMQQGRQARPVRAAGRAADVPARTASSRTSSAPTARSSGWRCSACATSTCGRRRSCASASRSPRRAPRSPTPRCPTRCWSTTTAGRSAGCPSAALAGERVEHELRSDAEPVHRARRRAARRALRPARRRGPVRPGGRRRAARSCGVLSIEMLAHALQHRPRGGAQRGRRRRDDRRRSPRSRSASAPTACVSDNGFCPDWIADNFDRYVDPLLPARLPDRGRRSRSASRSRSRSRCSPTGAAG